MDCEMPVTLDKASTRKVRNATVFDGGAVSFKVQLAAFIHKEKPGIYAVYCPALDLWSQGDTVAEARKNIAEVAELFIKGSYEDGALNRVLLDCGFTAEGKMPPKNVKLPPVEWHKSFLFNANFPLSPPVAKRNGKMLAA